jgi:hypothetical protein
MRIAHLIPISTIFVAIACSAASEGKAELERLESPLASASYVEAGSYFTESEDIDAWYSLMAALKRDFDHICGDTFCEGDYSNYQSLGLRCSVEQGTGTVGQCVWTFAASQDEIDPATGEVTVAAETWSCSMLLEPDTSLHDFVHVLSSSQEEPLFSALPGSERTLYDGLVDCL